jgi:hypothetical protein
LSPHVYHHHPWTRDRKASGPVRVADQLPGDSFSNRLALRITGSVGTMRCAYFFALIALVSLPAAIGSGSVIVIVSWVAQTFLQLVLLAVILVGQNVQAGAADKQALATYNDAEANLHEILAAQEHLTALDVLIEDTQRKILAAVSAQAPQTPWRRDPAASGERMRRKEDGP